ncbi:MAG TPA: tRNA pseudouridine(55) synthase TruB, partial [Candidatus Saccharimonadales bacterium]|nr:tRNA pseudouridine(55) synthase TruB [Candidatus Saccharimonadales bacterium]
MQGMLLVDKPVGWTSFDAVNYIRKMVARSEGKKPKQVKVGHAGTLDPFATGLLILLIGKEYTKKAAEFSKLDKTYKVTMKLGVTSSTGDPEGEITAVSDTKPTEKALTEALKRFTGEIEQVPPAYSAVKINGQRAYKLARAGKEVIIEPRQVTINRLELVDYSYPEVKLVVDVSSGTYIRSLVEDIGQALGTGAYTTALRRTIVGDFSIEK